MNPHLVVVLTRELEISVTATKLFLCYGQKEISKFLTRAFHLVATIPYEGGDLTSLPPPPKKIKIRRTDTVPPLENRKIFPYPYEIFHRLMLPIKPPIRNNFRRPL